MDNQAFNDARPGHARPPGCRCGIHDEYSRPEGLAFFVRCVRTRVEEGVRCKLLGGRGAGLAPLGEDLGMEA